jgi:hypothetical protein
MWTFKHTPQPPEWQVNWSAIREDYAWIRDMAGVQQEPEWHAEGDVEIHTRMVAEAMAADATWRQAEEAWNSAMASCEQAARCFKRSLYVGIDLLIAAGFKSHAILEVNAFGDQIPGVRCSGMETYDAEIGHCHAGIAAAGGLL